MQPKTKSLTTTFQMDKITLQFSKNSGSGSRPEESCFRFDRFHLDFASSGMLIKGAIRGEGHRRRCLRARGAEALPKFLSC